MIVVVVWSHCVAWFILKPVRHSIILLRIREENSVYRHHHFRLSVCPHRTTRLPQDGFSQYFVLGIFTEICRCIPKSYGSTSHFSWRPTNNCVIGLYNGSKLCSAWVTKGLKTQLTISLLWDTYRKENILLKKRWIQETQCLPCYVRSTRNAKLAKRPEKDLI